MPEYTWMCLNRLDSEYTSGPTYAKILDMIKFWKFKVLNMQALNARICVDRALNISWVLNMPGFWIWQGSKYTKATGASNYATKICIIQCIAQGHCAD